MSYLAGEAKKQERLKTEENQKGEQKHGHSIGRLTSARARLSALGDAKPDTLNLELNDLTKNYERRKTMGIMITD